ncbi:MAG: hypothetical protein EXQ56_09675 [Acidobacteria bacterium]|nr:hypothetical protein [Acidobacteriota bacterium]
MDILDMLSRKLRFLERFYANASESFTTVISKIENQEEPYDNFDSEDSVPFEGEWQDAQESLNILGQCCLSLVQRSFGEFLPGFISRSEQLDLTEVSEFVSRQATGKSDFKRYKNFYKNRYDIDWDKAPVGLSSLEEIALARNAIWHDGSIWDLSVKQDSKYFVRFPDSLFASDWEKDAWPHVYSSSAKFEPHRIEVTAEKLRIAIGIVQEFCVYLDNEWESRVQFK